MATFGVMRVRFCVTQSLICMPSASSVASPVWFAKTATTTFSGSRPLVVATGLLAIRGQSQMTAIVARATTASAATPASSRLWRRVRAGGAAGAADDATAGSVAVTGTGAVVDARRANARSLADWNRCPGCFSRQRATVRPSSGGASVPPADSSATGAVRMAVSVSVTVAAANARRPVTIS